MAGIESLRWAKKSWAKLGDVGFLCLLLALVSSGLSAVHPLYSEWHALVGPWLIKLSGGLMLCYVADPQYVVSRWLCAAPLRWFGIISYELYLIHQPIALWARAAVGSCDGSVVKYIGLVGGSFLTSVAIAAIFYKLFSLPILQAGRKKHLNHALVKEGSKNNP
jgi:peptidoglycan/LPS O-acetylase OafA/YrhL